MIEEIITDRSWNKIYKKGNAVYIFLAQKWETRKMWALRDWNLVVNRKNRHIFRKMNAYWFNLNLLRALSPDKKVIVIQEDKTILKSTIKDILTKGNKLNFLTEWFETQIFMKITDFN